MGKFDVVHWAPVIAALAMVIVAWINQRVPRITAEATAEANFREQLLHDRDRMAAELAECREELAKIKGAAERCPHTDCPVRSF
jgi:hypothetical protein